MGLVWSRIARLFSSQKQRKIVMVGLNNAGKTTTLYRMQLGEVVSVPPTIGSNVEELMYRNIRFMIWDLGGQDSSRATWASYYMNTDAVILVVDCTDRARLPIVSSELERILCAEALRNAIILVYANKQDVSGAMGAAELSAILRLSDIRDHEWHIQPCSALTGTGVMEGLAWIADRLEARS